MKVITTILGAGLLSTVGLVSLNFADEAAELLVPVSPPPAVAVPAPPLITASPLEATHVKYFGAFHELHLTSIEPKGWLKQWLVNQQKGQTGDMTPAGHPFDANTWSVDHTTTDCNAGLRGMWACHEQTGFYIDGLMRTGLLLGDETGLVAAARKQEFGAIAIAHSDGFIGPLNPDGSPLYYIQWPHTTFFRAFLADYSATGNPEILRALRAHYDGEIKSGVINPHGNRHICNIEALSWLYEQAGDKKYLGEAQRLMDESGQLKVLSADDYTAYNSHGATFTEKSQNPLIAFLYTGDTKYLKAGLAATNLLSGEHMLPAGAPSSCAGLDENGPDLSTETCVISDYAWAASYALMATGDATWGDRIERDIFNAGPSVVTKDFRAHQYYSSPNQAIATKNNYAGLAQFAPVHSPECCSGNVHRFMPDYIARMWLSDSSDASNSTIVAATYGPSRVSVKVGEQTVSVEEKTTYPFSDRIEFEVQTNSPIEFGIRLRIPAWCGSATLQLNGHPISEDAKAGTFVTIRRTFKNHDVIQLDLPASIEAKPWTGNGMIVQRGSLLFAYPIPTTTTIDKTNKYGKDPRFQAFNMVAKESVNWRYALDVDLEDSKAAAGLVMHRGSETDQPFQTEANVLTIDVPVKQIAESDWPLRTEVGKDRTSVMTPWPEKWNVADAPRQTITLVPYGATCLRLAIFPDAHKTEASAYRHPPEVVIHRKPATKPS